MARLITIIEQLTKGERLLKVCNKPPVARVHPRYKMMTTILLALSEMRDELSRITMGDISHAENDATKAFGHALIPSEHS